MTAVTGVYEASSRANPTFSLWYNWYGGASRPVVTGAGPGQQRVPTGLPNAVDVGYSGMAATPSPQFGASPSRFSFRVWPTASTNSSSWPTQAGPSYHARTSLAKAGWAFGTIGVVLLCGLFAWLYFLRRKRQEAQAIHGDGPQTDERKSLIEDWTDQERGSQSYEGDVSKDAPVCATCASEENEEKNEEMQTKVSHVSVLI